MLLQAPQFEYFFTCSLQAEQCRGGVAFEAGRVVATTAFLSTSASTTRFFFSSEISLVSLINHISIPNLRIFTLDFILDSTENSGVINAVALNYCSLASIDISARTYSSAILKFVECCRDLETITFFFLDS